MGTVVIAGAVFFLALIVFFIALEHYLRMEDLRGQLLGRSKLIFSKVVKDSYFPMHHFKEKFVDFTTFLARCVILSFHTLPDFLDYRLIIFRICDDLEY